MKRFIKMIAVLLTAVCCLAGCYPHRAMYEQADADQVTAKGKEMMQAWLAEHMPDAELTECAAYIALSYEDGNEYLSDYASGYIRTGEKLTGFKINTVTGAVYFAVDPETGAELNRIAEAYIREVTGLLPDETADRRFPCYVMAPVRDGDSVNEIPGMDFFDFGLPAGTDPENLEAFVRNPESRPTLWAEAYFILPEDSELSEYDLDAIEKLEEEHGLFFGVLEIRDGEKTFRVSSIRTPLLERRVTE